MKRVSLTVVGVSYRVTSATVSKLADKLDDDEVIAAKLVREPENTHHENAIKVVIDEAPFKGLHIGYLIRAVADEYAPLMDSGKISVVVALTYIDTQEGTLRAWVYRNYKIKENSRKTRRKGKSKEKT